MSAARCLVYLVTVLVAGACVVHAQERIKMCGRELIRLAVSSCGNARLKRSIPDIPTNQHQHTHHWDLDASTEEHHTTEMAHTPAESDGKKNIFSLAPHWYPLSSRIRRAAGKISDICCEKGCSMKELIQFC
ncbi:insulin-like 3 (Leydig cell) [Anabas testudineus]|uniref:insulin-like 3 (Leydig cell) n=1 Tax=Anabas testudineus TaxID=64144 RepID=UPI000E4608BF|nr:insulin-like 3 (Leydig cell) [Anabas testudineus]